MKFRHFVVERDESHPLWNEYKQWFDKICGFGTLFYSWRYYGYYGKFDVSDDLSNFGGSSKLITLEEWKQMIANPESYTIEDLRNAYIQGYDDSERMEKKDFDLFQRNYDLTKSKQ